MNRGFVPAGFGLPRQQWLCSGLFFQHHCRLRAVWLASCMKEKDLEVLGNRWVNMSQQYAQKDKKETNGILACINSSAASRSRRSLSVFSSGEAMP